MKIIFTLFIALLLHMQLLAQEVSTTFKIINTKKDPVGYASVIVTNRLDSLIRQSGTTDSNGIIVFKLPKGQYQVSITSVSFQPIEKGISISGRESNFLFTAEPLGTTLKAVVVTAQKPLMRQEDDKTIIDPENLASSSTSGYEVLEKTPGLFVDQDGNIYINSLSPAAVYINGREMKMSASDVATMLKSLPPNAISSIEILRTPSAKYDASGGGGIVNVVLRKGVRIGLTGSVNAGWQQGTYANEFIGFNLNNNDGKKTTYLNLNFSNRNTYERIKTDRLFSPDSILKQDAFTKYPAKVYFAGYGISYELNPKWNLSYDGRTSLNDYRNNTRNESIINTVSTGSIITGNLNRTSNDGASFIFSNGISAKYKIDSLGSEWTSDISFTYARNKARQVFISDYYYPVIVSTGGDGKSDNKRNHFSAQTDVKWKLPKKYTIETGIKTSILGFNSAAEYFRETNGIRTKDTRRTNTFKYNENINAIYLQGSKTIDDVVIKAGTRLENTNMNGRQIVPDDTSFTVHRTDLFPYLYLSKKLMSIAGYELRTYLIYRRTIARPVYEQLNPFPRYIDDYLSEVGNPALRPQFTTNYEANISVDERPLLAVGINKTKDIFTSVIYQAINPADTSQSQAYRTVDNLGSNKEWYFRGLGAIPPGKRYFFVVGAQYNHNHYQGFYEKQPLSFKKGTWTLFTYQSFKIDKLSQITINGFVRLKGQQQFYELSSFGSLNGNINRQFFKQKLILTLSINDIFSTNKNEFTITQGSVNANGFRKGDTRRFGINLRYNFGIRKKEENGFPNIEGPGQ
jgi:iron complex outermembrane recepter protein